MAASNGASARRAPAYAAGLVALIAVVFPALRPHPHDSFPLSNYPMFSYQRSRVNALPTAVAITPTGEVERLSPSLISGGYEPVRAFAVVEAAIAADDADALCLEIRERIVRNPKNAGVRVQVVTEVHDTVAWFDGQKDPLERRVHAEC